MEKTELNYKLIGAVIGGLVLLLLIIFGIYQYTKVSRELSEIKSNPGKLTEMGLTEQKRIVEALSKMMELPANEEPTVATVSDVEKLRDQSFFINAANGDKVVIYPNNKKAILYRPLTNKIIEVAPINLNISTQSGQLSTISPQPISPTVALREGGQPTVTPTPPLTRILFLNGTSVSNLSKTVENELAGKIPPYEVTGRDFAKKQDYEKTIVVALSLKKSKEARKIADILGAETGKLPEGEETPASADILIIIGKDKTVTPTGNL